MNNADFRDWYIMVCITAFSGAATAYVFMHPSEASFVTACGTLTALVGLYHWFVIKDSKTPDAKED